MKYRKFKWGVACWFRWHDNHNFNRGVAWGGMADKQKLLSQAIKGTLFKDHATMPPMPPVFKTYIVRQGFEILLSVKNSLTAGMVGLFLTPSQKDTKKAKAPLSQSLRLGYLFLTRRIIAR